MKKYISRAIKWLVAITLICAVILATGIVLIIIRSPNLSLQIGLIGLGGLMGIIFFSCLLAERSRTLITDHEKIIFPRGTEKNGKIILQKINVKFNEICSVESKFHKGDGICGDCFFHLLTLKDGTIIFVKLYAYGKDAEKEILDTIHQHIT